MIITRTPMRIPLGGGGTDLPFYSSEHGGFIVSAAIDKYTFVTVNHRQLDKLIRASYSKTEITRTLDELEHPLIREGLRLAGYRDSIEISSVADLPAGTGMGSSGSFAVGLFNALLSLNRAPKPQVELAELACHLEMEVLGEPIGKHDQYIAALGGVTCLDITKDGAVRAYPLDISADILEDFERKILIFYTGMVRSASEILEEQDKRGRAADREELVALYHRIREIGLRIKSALGEGDLDEFGRLLDEHWQAKRGLSSRVSNPTIDGWYELARANGALGGKIMGAGGGGFLMLYCGGDLRPLRAALRAEGLVEVRFRFDFEGTKVLAHF